VAAWAVDQLVRTQRKAISELFDAGDALRAAQDDVLAGRGDGQSLRAAVDRERTAVDALAAAARGLLSSEGHELSPTIVERVADTLHAAALDDEAREQVREGRLERELRHVGLGVLGAPLAGAPPAGAPAPPRKKKPTAANKQPAADRAADRAAERAAREERERVQRERAEARAVAREARRRAEHAERAHRVAAERRDRAAEALREAESQLNVAETELAEAQEALRAAETAAG
jgi:flagellar biosynthesis GTPase FlhF